MKLPELAELPIYALEHPIDAMPGSAWEFEAFRSAWTQRPRVLQVGQQYRQLSSIFLVDAPSAKHVWTPGFDPTEDGWLERLPELLLKTVDSNLLLLEEKEMGSNLLLHLNPQSDRRPTSWSSREQKGQSLDVLASFPFLRQEEL